MSYKFQDEDKEPNEFVQRIPFGITEVQLVGATAGETEGGKDYIEVGVVDKNGVEDSARVWFVGGAAKYSFDTLRSIVVHIAKTDADKEKARLAVEACTDNDELAALITSKCAGGHLWFTKYYDPERTYAGSDGVTRRSINKAVLGYEPKLKPELMPHTESDNGQTEITVDNVKEVFPGAKEVPFESASDAASNIPGKKGW